MTMAMQSSVMDELTGGGMMDGLVCFFSSDTSVEQSECIKMGATRA